MIVFPEAFLFIFTWYCSMWYCKARVWQFQGELYCDSTWPAAGCFAASRRASSDCAATASASASRLDASHSWKQIWCAAACSL